MKLDRFLEEDAFSKYQIGIEKIKNDFISLGYERYLWRKTLEEWEDAKKTNEKENKSDAFVVNELVQDFINQFTIIQSTDIAFIYPESYSPNYFMIQEIIKFAKSDHIIKNLIPEDDTINHLAIFDCKKSEEIQLMFHLVYSSVLGENFGGYKLLGEHLCYYIEFCSDESMIYTLEGSNELVHFQGYATRKDTNPYTIFNTRKNIDELINKGYFSSEFELFRNLKNVIMPYLQKMYVKSAYDDPTYDWKLAKSILRGDLIKNGVIKSKWKHEQSLFLLIKKKYPDAVFQYRPKWLSPQSLDIYIPKLNIGIEYQGIQHYSAVDFFGGKLALEHRIFLDNKKREICKRNNITLIEWNYNIDINMKNIQEIISKKVIK